VGIFSSFFKAWKVLLDGGFGAGKCWKLELKVLEIESVLLKMHGSKVLWLVRVRHS